MALRRWKPFDAIDAAIEASSDPAGEELQCARVLRSARAEIVELLCDVPEDGAAEELCRVLDDVMVESLVTLKSVPVTPAALASTDLAEAVGALGEHQCAQIRGLSRDVVRWWRASVESDLARARAAMEELDKLSDEQQVAQSLASVTAAGEGEKKMRVKEASRAESVAPAKDLPLSPKKRAPTVVRGNRAGSAKSDMPAKVSKKGTPVVGAGRANMDEVPPKKKPTDVVGNGGGGRAVSYKMEATKRKLHEGYREAADAKWQRKMQIIQAPKMVEQRQRKMHPIMRERSQA